MTIGEACKCCGGQTSQFTRLVYWEGNAYAAYYAIFTESHPQVYVSALISTGNWDTDASPSERSSFFIRICNLEESYQVSLGNAADSPWGEIAMMGRTLDKSEALKHPNISDVFHIADHILSDDMPVIAYLNRDPL